MSGFDTKTYKMLIDGGYDRQVVMDRYGAQSKFFFDNYNLELMAGTSNQIKELVDYYFGIIFSEEEIRKLLCLYPKVLITCEVKGCHEKEALAGILDMIMDFFLSCEFPSKGHNLKDVEVNKLIFLTRAQAHQLGFKTNVKFKKSHFA